MNSQIWNQTLVFGTVMLIGLAMAAVDDQGINQLNGALVPHFAMRYGADLVMINVAVVALLIALAIPAVVALILFLLFGYSQILG